MLVVELLSPYEQRGVDHRLRCRLAVIVSADPFHQRGLLASGTETVDVDRGI